MPDIWRRGIFVFHKLYVDEKAKPKSRSKDPNAKIQRHAAQIYAEMLAQVCHEDLYKDNMDGSQEVPASL